MFGGDDGGGGTGERVVPIAVGPFTRYIFLFVHDRDTKDALVVTNCGAEAIAFLKVREHVETKLLFYF